MKAKKLSLVERVIAKKGSGGKFRLLEAGRQWLKKKRFEQEGRLPRIVRTAKPTHKRKTVLFVCYGGVHFSPVAMLEFERVARKNPVNANLVLKHAAILDLDAKLLADADFVVLTQAESFSKLDRKLSQFHRVLSELGRVPKVIRAEARLMSTLLSEAHQLDVLKKIRSELEKEEKK